MSRLVLDEVENPPGNSHSPLTSQEEYTHAKGQGSIKSYPRSHGIQHLPLNFKNGRTLTNEFIVFHKWNTGVIISIDSITDHTLAFLSSRRVLKRLLLRCVQPELALLSTNLLCLVHIQAILHKVQCSATLDGPTLFPELL